MDLHFCKLCNNLMDFCLENIEDTLGDPVYVCSRCSNKETIQDEIVVNSGSMDSVKDAFHSNEYFQLDPTLPMIQNKNIQCVNPQCESKQTKQTKIKYIKYDEVNLKYMYLCCTCGQKWTNETHS